MSSRRAKHKSKCWRRRNDQTRGKAIPFEEQPTSRDDSHCFAFPRVNQGSRGGHFLFRSQAPRRRSRTSSSICLLIVVPQMGNVEVVGDCYNFVPVYRWTNLCRRSATPVNRI